MQEEDSHIHVFLKKIRAQGYSQDHMISASMCFKKKHNLAKRLA